MSQKENIRELLQLIKAFPDREIVPMVDNDICNDDYSYTMGKWGSAKLDEYYIEENNERIYFKSHDLEELTDELTDEKFDKEWEGKTDEEMEELATKIVNSYNWIECISVRIEL